MALAREVSKQRPQRTLLETAPEVDHQAIGGVERYHSVMQDQIRALKLQVEVDFNMKLNVAVAAAKWLVRHAAWIQHRFSNSSELKTTGFFRVHNKNYAGAIVNLFEMVLARRPEEVSHGRKTSKWDSRWRLGIWLGKTEISDEHLLFADGEVSHHRVVRRFSAGDPRRWMTEEIQAMRVTPWNLKEIPEEQPAAVLDKPQTTMKVRGGHILPLRKKPLTPGCAGCAHVGQPSHGFRHSVECRAAKRSWLDRQLGPPETVEP